MIFLFQGVIKNNTITPLVLQQNSKEIKQIYTEQVYKTARSNLNDNINAWACELYKEVIIIETIHGKIEIEFVNNYSVNEAMKYILGKMGSISDYNSDQATFYKKLKDNI